MEEDEIKPDEVEEEEKVSPNPESAKKLKRSLQEF